MIYIGTIIVFISIAPNQTHLGLATVVEKALGTIQVPWSPPNRVQPKHLTCLAAVENEKTPKCGIINGVDMSQRLMFELYGPQGMQGTETDQLTELKVALIEALGTIGARLQIVDFYRKVQDRVEYLHTPPVPKKKFRVDLTTYATMRGTIEVNARDVQEAQMVALEKAGNVNWEYMGTCDGDQGPEVQDVHPAG